jgi:surface carbohydrate biosynthesis protein
LIGEQEKKFYKSIKTKFAITGSILNNQINKNFYKSLNKKRVIVFISEYRVHEKNLSTYEDEIILLPILADFCITNNYKLTIAGSCYKNSHESNKEYNFYKCIMNKFTNLKWNYLPKKNLFSNYDFLNRISLLVSFGSTLGLEAFSRGVKVLRFQRQFDSRCENLWIFNKKDGPYLSRNFNKKNIFKKINKIFHDNNSFKVKNYNNIKLSYLICFDPGNKYIKKIIT